MIGILGGSFNPIHLGHTNIAAEIHKRRNLQKVVFIPTNYPPHKSQSILLDGEHRLNMVKLAIDNNPDFECSDVEISKPGISYSCDTINRLLAENESAEYAFIVGADSLLELHTWERIENLLNCCEFIATSRPGFDLDWSKKTEFLSRLFDILSNKQLLDKISFEKTSKIDISATRIRENCRKGIPFEDMVPPGVANYIREHQLYKEKACI